MTVTNRFPNLLTEILFKLLDDHRARQQALDERNHRNGALSAQGDPRLDEYPAGRAKGREILKRFHRGELSLEELQSVNKGLARLCAMQDHEVEEPSMSPWNWVMQEFQIEQVPLDAGVLREYLAIVGIALRRSSDATKLNLDDLARRDTAVAVARLDRNNAFMKRLLTGIWDQFSEAAKAMKLRTAADLAARFPEFTESTPPNANDDAKSCKRAPNATEQAVLDLLCAEQIDSLDAVQRRSQSKRPTQEWLSPRAVGRDCDGQFKTTLSHMRDLGWIDNARHHGLGGGYFLTDDGLKLANRRSGPGQD